MASKEPDKLTVEDSRFKSYLRALADTGRPVESAEIAKVEVAKLDDIEAREPSAKRMIELALRRFQEKLEREVFARGVTGFNEDILYRGKAIGKKRIVSDTCLLSLVKKFIPAYRDRPPTAVDAGVKSGVLVTPGQTQDADQWSKNYKRPELEEEEGDNKGRELKRGS